MNPRRCPTCGKLIKSLGWGSHRAAHYRRRTNPPCRSINECPYMNNLDKCPITDCIRKGKNHENSHPD